MKKIISIISLVLATTIFVSVFYLNEVLLPKKTKALIIRELGRATTKKVNLDSVRFNIFKGIVLKGLKIYDDAGAIVDIKEASCGILVLPLFRKEIIVPALKVESPKISAERRPDKSINILELVPKDYKPETGFRLIVRRIRVRHGRVSWADAALKRPFGKEIENLDLDAYFTLPARIRFDCAMEIKGADMPMRIEASGEYLIREKRFAARIKAGNLAIGEFGPYYEEWAFVVKGGLVDLIAGIEVKDDILNASLDGRARRLAIVKGDISSELNSSIKAKLQYGFNDKSLSYSGGLGIEDLDLEGLKVVDKIEDVSGAVKFDSSRLWAEKLSATVFGQPAEARINLVNFSNPIFDIYADSDINLSVMQGILRDRFKIAIPAEAEGFGKVSLSLQIGPSGVTGTSGRIAISGAGMRMPNNNTAVKDITGEFTFTSNSVSWADVGFRYLEDDYTTSGQLTNFQSPGVQMQVSSDDLKCESILAINDKLITISKLTGQYLGSAFEIEGHCDLADPSRIDADLNGAMDISVNDLKGVFKDLRDKLDAMKPGGRLHAEFGLDGDLKDLRYCAINARLTSDLLYLYGFRLTGLGLDYAQQEGRGEVKSLAASMYDGKMSATGSVDLVSKDLQYALNAQLGGVKIEKLKLDTPFKESDIAGTVELRANLAGCVKDTAKLTGAGRIVIRDGRLWQLNMFKGLGILIFTSDFSDVSMREGFCDFTVEDSAVFTDELTLKSDLMDMYGPARIGFDKSIKARLKIDIPEESVRYSMKKNITLAIGRYSIVDISGTLKDPKYTMRPSVAGIVEGIKNILFNE